MFPPEVIINEIQGLHSNLEIFKCSLKYFELCLKVYDIIQKANQNKSFNKFQNEAFFKGITNTRLLIHNFIEFYKLNENEFITKSIENMEAEQKVQNFEKAKENKKENHLDLEFHHLNGFIKKSLNRLLFNGQEPKEFIQKCKYIKLEIMK